MNEITRADLERLSKELTDQGLLIEAGFVGLRLAAINPDASQTQIAKMRMAFFAGAQHLFSSILGILDQGVEPTDKDMQRMDAIERELSTFVDQLRRKTCN